MIILRRRKLGNGSTKGIVEHTKTNVRVIRNDKLNDNDSFDLVLRWGCNSSIRSNKVINLAKHIKIVGDKKETRKILKDNNVSIPETFFNLEEATRHLRNNNWSALLGRETHHHQGRKMFVCRNVRELEDSYDRGARYWSVVIKKEKEYRVFCYFGRVWCVAEKVPENDEVKRRLAWNNYQGGIHFETVRWKEWSFKACQLALEAQKAIGIDFAGIDIIEDAEGNCYVLELNSAHSLTSEYRKRIFAKCVDWTNEYYENTGELPKHYEIPEFRKRYSTYIHPTLVEDGVE